VTSALLVKHLQLEQFSSVKFLPGAENINLGAGSSASFVTRVKFTCSTISTGPYSLYDIQSEL